MLPCAYTSPRREIPKHLEWLHNETILNDTLLRACRRQRVSHTPVWLMRQAGRHLPEFRSVRAKHSFFEVCTTPDLAAEVTIQPVDRYAIDAAIIFSDILVIPRAFGFEVETPDNPDGTIRSVHMENSLAGPSVLAERILDIDTQTIIDRLKYVYDALVETRKRLKGRVPLLGFAGAPWTLMAFTIQGKNTRSFKSAINWLNHYPQESHKFLDKYADVIAEHLIQQIIHGAHAVQIFDSWGSALSPSQYEEFSLPYMVKVAQTVRAACPNVPIICFPKETPFATRSVAESGAFDVLSVDCSANIGWTKDEINTAGGQHYAPLIALQGNLNPDVILQSKANIIARTTEMIHSFAGEDNKMLLGYVANLGGGCINTFDPEHVETFVNTVHQVSAAIIVSADTSPEEVLARV